MDPRKDIPEHGGNVYYFARKYNLNPFVITDMSASVNPFAKNYLKEVPLDPYFYLQFYPDPECSELRSILSQKLNIGENSILLGNGSLELIQTVILWSIPEGAEVLLPQPTFTAYKKYLNLREDLAIFSPFSLNPSEWMDFLDSFLERKVFRKVVFLCNPNNPTCWILRKSEILERISQFEEVLFLIDEAFIDFCEEESLAVYAPTLPNLIVFRSLTKFYGLAGARVGYVIANQDTISHLKRFHPTWQVNTLSQIFAIYLLKNQVFICKTRDFFLKEVKKFEDYLQRMGIWHRVGPVNFVFFYIESGLEFWEWLIRERAILIRSCSNFEGLNGNFLRVSLREEEANDRFLEALEEWLKLS